MRTIRGNLIVSISAIAIGICLLLSGINSILLSRTATQGMKTSVAAASKAYASAIQNKTANFMSEINSMSSDSRITPSASLDDMKKLMDELSKKSDFRSVSVATAKGVPYDRPDLTIADRDYFKSALAGVPYISSPLITKKDNTIVLYVATKVDNAAKYDGIILGELSNDVFSQIIKDVSIGQKGYGFIIDKTGTIIAHKDNKLVEAFTNYKTLAEKDRSYSELGAFVTKALNDKNGTGEIKLGGAAQYAAYTPIAGTDGWILVMTADKNEMMASYNEGLKISIGMTAAFLVISILYALIFSKSIGKPISQISKRLELLSRGDLNTPVPEVRARNEIRKLSDSLNATVSSMKAYIQDIHGILSNISDGNLRVTSNQEYLGDFSNLRTDMDRIIDAMNAIMSGIASSADQVASGSSLVSSSAIVLSQGATEQAGAVQQLTAAMEQISEQTGKNAENAETANDLARNARKNAQQGNEQMRDMLKAMEDINLSSSNIGKIIKVIDDIAFQTNILALNAAVEAARAGEHGKGFAVVAEEVRTLAAKSANAAKETTELIEGSIRKVEKGTKIAEATAGALDTIVTEISSAADLVGAIAAASNEQALGIEQVNQGILQVSQVVQSNAATSEESAAASEELSSQATHLKEVVSIFKLRNEVNSPFSSDALEPGGTYAVGLLTAGMVRSFPPEPAGVKAAIDKGKY